MNEDNSQEDTMSYQQYIVSRKGKVTWPVLADEVNAKFGTHYSWQAVRGIYRRLKDKADHVKKHGEPVKKQDEPFEVISKDMPPSEQVIYDRKVKKLSETKQVTDKKYKALLAYAEGLEEKVEAIGHLAQPSVNHVITSKVSKGLGGEATAIVVASDWHVEEKVSPDAINGSPGYTLDIATKRAKEFFEVALKLRDIEAQSTPVPTMVIALLGDFITGNLHRWHGTEKNTVLEPVEAAFMVKGLLKSGIDFLLKESDLNLVLPCHVGNHARITSKSEDSEHELGNSLEYFIYGFLAQEYANNPRVKFLISKSYASRLKVYDTVLRFHHGHKIRYQGGVGGIDVPANKYVLRKNTHWYADYDIFGHHHQKKMGTRFISNASMIGYNAYASDSGMEYQGASQTYFVINKRWNEIIDYRPILFSV